MVVVVVGRRVVAGGRHVVVVVAGGKCLSQVQVQAGKGMSLSSRGRGFFSPTHAVPLMSTCLMPGQTTGHAYHCLAWC